MFRRKSADLVSDATSSVTEATPPAPQQKGYTPSKRELGVTTPKRASDQRRRPADAAPANRKEAMRQMRERQRAERMEAQEGMRNGDERYLMARDRGPERALVRDIVDSRRTVGTYFFGGAVLVLLGSQPFMPRIVQLVTNILWVVLALGVVIDSVLIARKIKRLVRERFPKTTQRMGGLHLYGIMRGITFRRMRMPKARVAIGDKI
jgi:hypothetical protein